MPFKKYKNVIKILKCIFILIFFYFLIKRIDFVESLNLLKKINLYIFVYIFFVILVLFFVTIRWKIILKTKNVNAKIKDLFFYKLSELYMNYITPAAFVGGEPVKAFLLNKKYKVNFTKGLSTAIIDKSFDIAINVFLGMVVFLLFLLNFLKEFGIVLFMFIFVLLLFVLFAFFYILKHYLNGKKIIKKKLKFLSKEYREEKRLKKFKKFNNNNNNNSNDINNNINNINNINDINDNDIALKLEIKKHKKKDNLLNHIYLILCDFEEHIVDFFHKNKEGLFKSVLVSIIISITMYLEYFFMLKSLGIPLVSVFFPLIVLSMLGIAYLIPVPAAMGSLELFEAMVFVMFKLPIEASIAFVILLRLKDVTLALIGVLYLFFNGINIKKINIGNK